MEYMLWVKKILTTSLSFLDFLGAKKKVHLYFKLQIFLKCLD